MERVYIDKRAVDVARYIIMTKDTERGAAKKFGVSKSTVHKDLSERILKINPVLAAEVREILDENKAERHLRGGMAMVIEALAAKKETKIENIHYILRGYENLEQKLTNLGAKIFLKEGE